MASVGNTSTTQPSTLAAPSGSGGGSASAGNGGSPGQGGLTLSFPGASYADALKYAHCMRSHGVVNFPDPGANGDFTVNAGYVDPGSPQFQSVNKTCAELIVIGPLGFLALSDTRQSLGQTSRKTTAFRAEPGTPGRMAPSKGSTGTSES